MTVISGKTSIAQQKNLELLPVVVDHLWNHLSPGSPKYHVEAVRAIWQLEDLVAPDTVLTVSLLTFMADEHVQVGTADRFKRFMTLWNHTLPAPVIAGKAGAISLARRGSTVPTVADAAQTARRVEILSEPLFLVLDALQDPTAVSYVAVKDWLLGLPTLDQIFAVLVRRMQASLDNNIPAAAIDHECQQRHDEHEMRSLAYYLEVAESILRIANDWMWTSLTALDMEPFGEDGSGVTWLAQA